MIEWQIVAEVDHAKLLLERPDDHPYPAIELEQMLPDGTPVKVIWSYNEKRDRAKLVTVHFFDDL